MYWQYHYPTVWLQGVSPYDCPDIETQVQMIH